MQLPLTAPLESEVNFVKAVTGIGGLFTRSYPTTSSTRISEEGEISTLAIPGQPIPFWTIGFAQLVNQSAVSGPLNTLLCCCSMLIPSREKQAFVLSGVEQGALVPASKLRVPSLW